MTVGELRKLLAPFSDSDAVEFYTQPGEQAEIVNVYREDSACCCIDLEPMDEEDDEGDEE